MRNTTIILVLAVMWAAGAGFSLDNAIVPQSEILSGGPPKDGIPAILAPDMVPAADAGFLDGDDVVIGVVVGGKARAYPVKILNWHEVVNDDAGGEPFVVTY